MPIGPARMPLFDHLGELRMRLTRIVACLLVCVFVFYAAAPAIVELLMMPVAQYLPADLQFLTPLEGFSLGFKVALWASAVTCSPMIIWQILAFFLPALKPKERKWFIPTFVVALVLFIFGTVFCYFVILEPAFSWLIGQGERFGQVFPTGSSYVETVLLFEVAFGIAFELPLIVFYLVLFEVIPYKKLRESWRIVYVVLLVVSAIVTPDASPVTMLLMFAALAALYEASLFVARIALRNKVKRQQQEEELDEELSAIERL